MNTVQAILRLRQVIRRQHKALATEENYVFWLRRYMGAIDQMPGTLASNKKLERFLTDLACRHHVSASTQNQALNAILFFYKHVLNRPIQEVAALRAKRPGPLKLPAGGGCKFPFDEKGRGMKLRAKTPMTTQCSKMIPLAPETSNLNPVRQSIYGH